MECLRPNMESQNLPFLVTKECQNNHSSVDGLLFYQNHSCNILILLVFNIFAFSYFVLVHNTPLYKFGVQSYYFFLTYANFIIICMELNA